MAETSKSNASSLLTIHEAARRLACSRNTVYGLIEDGVMPFVQVGKAKGYRIDACDLEAFIRERKQTKGSRSDRTLPARPRLKHIKY